MKIGIIGATSDIARKAYLPIYARQQDAHDFVLYSRDGEKAAATQAKWGFAASTAELAALDDCDLVMIHAATDAHFELAQHFLQAGVHVFVDKPVSEDYDEVQQLYDLAQAQDRLFIVGFNRRYAPMLPNLKNLDNKNFIKITKNLAAGAGDPLYKLYDVFIHPLDTLVYLLDGDITEIKYQLAMDAGKLRRVMVSLQTDETLAFAVMNLEAGSYSEDFTVETPEGAYSLSGLDVWQALEGSERYTQAPGGWDRPTDNRGFENMVAVTFAAAERYDELDKTRLAVDLQQDKILLTHQIIDEIVKTNHLK